MKKKIISGIAVFTFLLISLVSPLKTQAQTPDEEDKCRHFVICNNMWHWGCTTGWSIWGECQGNETTPEGCEY